MNKIARIFNLETTFDKQLSLILSEISANPKYYRCITYILDDLSNIIHMLYPYRTINVYPFGSAVTGLALKGSDVDLFVDFNGTIQIYFIIFNFHYGLQNDPIVCNFRGNTRKICPVTTKD